VCIAFVSVADSDADFSLWRLSRKKFYSFIQICQYYIVAV
jgi:hypothetical protein